MQKWLHLPENVQQIVPDQRHDMFPLPAGWQVVAVLSEFHTHMHHPDHRNHNWDPRI